MIVNINDINELIKKEKIFKYIYEIYGEPPNWFRPQSFETLVKIILEQQLSLASAKAHFTKLKENIQNITPSKMLEFSDEEYRMCHISRQKIKYIKNLSMAIESKQLILEELELLEEEEIREKLCKIKGIGDWSSNVYLMISMQLKDIFPLGDVALINAIKDLTKLDNINKIEKRVIKWKPYRSLAAYFLWHYYIKKRNKIVMYD